MGKKRTNKKRNAPNRVPKVKVPQANKNAAGAKDGQNKAAKAKRQFPPQWFLGWPVPARVGAVVGSITITLAAVAFSTTQIQRCGDVERTRLNDVRQATVASQQTAAAQKQVDAARDATRARVVMRDPEFFDNMSRIRLWPRNAGERELSNLTAELHISLMANAAGKYGAIEAQTLALGSGTILLDKHVPLESREFGPALKSALAFNSTQPLFVAIRFSYFDGVEQVTEPGDVIVTFDQEERKWRGAIKKDATGLKIVEEMKASRACPQNVPPGDTPARFAIVAPQFNATRSRVTFRIGNRGGSCADRARTRIQVYLQHQREWGLDTGFDAGGIPAGGESDEIGLYMSRELLTRLTLDKGVFVVLRVSVAYFDGFQERDGSASEDRLCRIYVGHMNDWIPCGPE